MNYHKITPKLDFSSNLLISTPSSSSTIMKFASNRHEKSSSLLRLPPIRSSKAFLPSTRKNDPSLLSFDRHKTFLDGKETNDSSKEGFDISVSSPLRRILSNNKSNIKDNRSIDPHQKNLKENTGMMLDLYNDLKLLKSPLNENKHTLNHDHMYKSPKSEQMHFPKMQTKRLEGLGELKIGGLHQINDNQNKHIMPTSLKNTDHFQMFFNPAILFSKQLIEKDDLPKLEPSKCSSKKNGVIKAYAANTHQGLIRNYNEDRVAIILNIIKPSTKKVQDWPSCSFFAIYDGHGGSKCAEFLRDNLHHYIIKDSFFPENPKMAIKRGLQLAEKTFIEQAQTKNSLEKSGSCAILVLIVNDICYIANVGDSRALLCNEKGNKIVPLSLDHKPGSENERKRIVEAGGQIYQSHTTTNENSNGETKIVTGPFRVFPGRLSVSRTFGDVEAKLEEYGGNPKVIIAEPDIQSFKISSKNDFILLGCDGIFDKLNNVQVIQSIWETLRLNKECKSLHEFSGRAVENMMKEALSHKSLDNVTAVIICFKNFKNTIFPQKNKNLMEKQGNLLLKKQQFFEMEYVNEELSAPTQ